MSIFAGKFVYGASFKLPSQLIFNPWTTKNIIVRCCSNSGEKSADFPVRYVPKRSSKTNKPKESDVAPKDLLAKDDSSNVEFLNDKEKRKKGSIFEEKLVDGDFKSGNLRSQERKIGNTAVKSQLGERGYGWTYAESKATEELHEFDEMEGPEGVLDDVDFHNGKYEIKHLTVEPGKTKEEAEKIAIRLLAARAYTAVELTKKLVAKNFSPKVASAVISEFQNRGLINDYLYAELFSRSRWSSSSWGPRRIKQALIKKGVNDSVAQKAIKSVLEDGEPGDDDQVSRLGLSKPSMDHLFTQALKQWLRAKDLPSEKQKSRIITWLQYRGFNWGIISFILKKLQSEHPP